MWVVTIFCESIRGIRKNVSYKLHLTREQPLENTEGQTLASDFLVTELQGKEFKDKLWNV